MTQESDDKKVLENPGSKVLLASWGGAKSGLPFIVFLNARGQKITDSNRLPGGQNIGCPVSKEEIAEFDKILRATASRMTEEQRARIADYFKKANQKR